MAFIALLHVTPVDKPIGPTLLEIYTAAGGGQELEDASKAEAEIRGFGFAAVYIARLLVVSGRTLTEVPTLVELTSNKFRKGIRLLALETLSQLGIEAKPALPALRELLMDKDADIRESAGYILFHFQFQGNLDELPDFVKSLQLNETRSKEFSATIKELVRQNDELTKVFKDGGESVAEFIPLISRGLKSSNPVYQRTAILSLGTFGPAAKAVVPDLIEFTKSKVEATREAALLAIRQIDPTRLPANSGNESKR